MPRVTISINAPGTDLDSEILSLELPTGFTIRDLKATFEAETNLPTQSQHYFLNGRPLQGDDQTLEDAGIGDGDMLAVLIRRPGGEAQGQQQQSRAGGGSSQAGYGGGAGGSADGRRRGGVDPEDVRLNVLGNPASQAELRRRKPELAAALSDPVRWRELFMMEQRHEEQAERERQSQIALLNEDPFNVDAQRRIEEIIRQDRVIENLQHAYENNPEVFVRVHMLYINAEVNGHPVKAFVDSGAQATIMSPSCAEACGIMRLIDTRYSGIARGVGTAKILGRVHHAEIKIGGAVMPCAFTVMEGKDVDLLFGLDMLKRYKAKIDLEKNALCFEGIEVPFLPEAEIPKAWEEAEMSEPTVSGPNGTEIGARSGAVRPAGTTAAGGSATAAGPPVPAQPGPAAASRSGGGAALGPSAPTPAGDPFPAADIKQLEDLGFRRDDVIRALQATNGNVEYAAGLLFSE